MPLDIRYPVTCNGSDIVGAIRRKAEQAGLTAEKVMENPPLYFPADHPIVHLLQGTYKEVKGVPAELYATGGMLMRAKFQGKQLHLAHFLRMNPTESCTMPTKISISTVSWSMRRFASKPCTA